MNIKLLRKMLIDLLDDENGINETGYNSLRGYVSSLGLEVDDQCGDIWTNVVAKNNYWFLPEDHGLKP